jgi:hypothetical protein
MNDIQLKDNNWTQDPRLDRIVQFDEQSRNYPVRELLPEKKLRSYTWHCSEHLDQGQEGACVGFGCVHELIARPSRVYGVGEAYAHGVYKEAQTIDKWPGENYEGTSVLAGVEVLRKRGWIENYYWAFGLDDLIVGVGRKGPAVIGVSWYRNMRTPDHKGFIHASGRSIGGHCVLCKGVNIKKEYFTIHNSWGIRWGVHGDCYISFEDMDKLLRNQGEAVFFMGRHRRI